MTEQTIESADMSIKTVFQEFYRVPDYQREYVWGQLDKRGRKGDEVEQFLADIYSEFQQATERFAPEYFIGTIVVCPSPDSSGVLDLIDGQQRITTTYLTLCAIRDFFTEATQPIPSVLPGQIAASTIDWQGNSEDRERLDLLYEDSHGVLTLYAHGKWKEAPETGSRSIANLASAYETIRDFIRTDLQDDPILVQRFFGYFTNKVKLIRIQTSSVTKALKIFETINDRGLGLDAMDLLKNLLFMRAKSSEFEELKKTWKEMTDFLYSSDEKPLRFLRYLIFADYEVTDSKLQEDAIYDWFKQNVSQTNHEKHPLSFARRLRDAAKIYAYYVDGRNPNGTQDEGVLNTRTLGGRAIRNHYILLLACRHLGPDSFAKISLELEQLMFTYLMSDISTKTYERELIEGARKLRSVSDLNVEEFIDSYFKPAKSKMKDAFFNKLLRLHTWDTRAFRLRYLLAKITQTVDCWAYGSAGPHGTLSNYIDGNNDIEHVLPANASADALREYGSSENPDEEAQRLGNLVFIERPINQLLGNMQYSRKVAVYGQSQFLLAKCHATKPTFGIADRITRVVQTLESFSVWNLNSIVKRQLFIANLALKVWGIEDMPKAG
jgi:uncharacterized protein with ParB-like and HNH nuclease domain